MARWRWRTLFEEVQSQRDDSDRAREIAADYLDERRSAMRCRLDGKTWVYAGEMPLDRTWAERSLPYAGDKAWRWMRFELRAADGGGVARGDELVCATLPYTQRRVTRSPFRPRNKDVSYDELRERARARPSAEALLNWVEHELSFEPWERGHRLTAAVSSPADSLADRSRGVAHGKLALVLGLCPDVAAATEQILASDACKELHDMTDGRTIRVRHPKSTRRGPIPAEVADEGMFFLALSVTQALAGPPREGERYVGRPVAHWVDLIYRAHLRRATEVIERRRRD